MNLPIDFCERMRELVGGEYDDFIKSYDTQINRGVRINKLKCDTLPKLFSDSEKVLWCPDGYYVKDGTVSGNHPYHAAGVIYFQEPSAMCVAEVLPLCDDAKVLDLCAAPGGKTTHIGTRMKTKFFLEYGNKLGR